MKKTKIYSGKILNFSIYETTIKKRKIKREIIEHRGAAAILAFDENDKVILVKQNRFPHGNVLEIPAGTLEKNESPKTCALREIQEETGYKAKNMTPLIKFYPSIGYNTEIIYCYVATGVKKIGELKLDDDEIISVKKIDMQKLLKMIKTGKIIDSKTICTILTYAAKNNIS